MGLTISTSLMRRSTTKIRKAMKITVRQLKQIIKEEIQRLNEDTCPCGIERADCDYHKQESDTNQPNVSHARKPLAASPGDQWPDLVKKTWLDVTGGEAPNEINPDHHDEIVDDVCEIMDCDKDDVYEVLDAWSNELIG